MKQTEHPSAVDSVTLFFGEFSKQCPPETILFETVFHNT